MSPHFFVKCRVFFFKDNFVYTIRYVGLKFSQMTEIVKFFRYSENERYMLARQKNVKTIRLYWAVPKNRRTRQPSRLIRSFESCLAWVTGVRKGGRGNLGARPRARKIPFKRLSHRLSPAKPRLEKLEINGLLVVYITNRRPEGQQPWECERCLTTHRKLTMQKNSEETGFFFLSLSFFNYTGYGLKCYQCQSTKSWADCASNKIEATCSSNQDTCGKSFIHANAGNISTKAFVTSCAVQSACNQDQCKALSQQGFTVNKCEVDLLR